MQSNLNHTAMKKLMLIVLLFPVVLMAQSVSVLSGISCSGNAIFGAEFKTNTVGVFVERTINTKYNNLSAPLPNAILSAPIDVIYDGIMIGTTVHIKAMSDILLSAGFGMLNKNTIYYISTQTVYNPNGGVISFADNKMVQISNDQTFAFEISCGKDFFITDNVIFGIKGGVNSCTDIFGTLSVGCKF